ncbi:hypothetical protein Tco_0045200, partial [Tanacetum coccineum]
DLQGFWYRVLKEKKVQISVLAFWSRKVNTAGRWLVLPMHSLCCQEGNLRTLEEAPLALLLPSLDLPELESLSWVPFDRENRQISSSNNLCDLMILVNSGCGNRTDIHGCFQVV